MRKLQSRAEEVRGRELKPEETVSEADLRRALRPVELPEGFICRTQERLAQRQRQRAWSWMWRGMAAAVLLAVVLLSGWGLTARRERQERAKAAEAKQQFAMAMQVTARSLRRASQGAERRADRGEE